MKAEIITNTGAPRLIVIFAGWAMDATPFRGLRRRGYDIAVVWDYTSPEVDWSFAEPYAEICIVAWSLGVSVADPATGVTAALNNRVTLRLAVNGTLRPIHDSLGIPEAIFRGTATNLCERSLAKFYLRTAGSLRTQFFLAPPQRTIQSVQAELEVFLSGTTYAQASTAKAWSRAVVSMKDAIFPPRNQLRAWDDVPTDVIDAPHFADFQHIINHYIIDKENTAERFAAGAASYDSHASVQRHIAGALLDKARRALGADGPHRILEVGCGTGALSHALAQSFPAAALEMWDLCPVAQLAALGTLTSGDAEVLAGALRPEAYDLIISASTMQWFNSPRSFLERCARALATGAVVAVSTFGPDNLEQVSRHTGLTLPSISLEQWKKLAVEGLELIEASQEHLPLHFDSAMAIFRHLKLTGVNSLGANSTALLRKAQAGMTAEAKDGIFELTYHPIYLIYKKK